MSSCMVVCSTNFVWTLAWLGCYANLWELSSRIWCCRSIFIIRRKKILGVAELKLGECARLCERASGWLHDAGWAGQGGPGKLGPGGTVWAVQAFAAGEGRWCLRAGDGLENRSRRLNPRASRRGCHGSSAKLPIYLFILIEIEKKALVLAPCILLLILFIWYISVLFCNLRFLPHLISLHGRFISLLTTVKLVI